MNMIRDGASIHRIYSFVNPFQGIFALYLYCRSLHNLLFLTIHPLTDFDDSGSRGQRRNRPGAVCACIEYPAVLNVMEVHTGIAGRNR